MTKVTYKRFGDAVGLPKSRITKLVRDEVIDLNRGLDQSVIDYCQDLRDRLSNKKKVDGTLTDHRARHEKIKADLAELELKKRQRELIPANQVEEAWGMMISTCRAKLLGIPNRSGRIVLSIVRSKITQAEQREINEAMRKEIYAALSELASKECIAE